MDVVAVTGAHDLCLVRTALAFGVVHHLLKPFTFTSVRQQLGSPHHHPWLGVTMSRWAMEGQTSPVSC